MQATTAVLGQVPAQFKPLLKELDRVQNKRVYDDLRFGVNEKSEWILEEAPDCLTRLCLLAYRFFVWVASLFVTFEEPLSVDLKMSAYAHEVEEFLQSAGKEKRFEQATAFLLKYSPVIREMYRCESSMYAAGKFSEERHRGFEMLRTASLTRDLVLTEQANRTQGHRKDEQPCFADLPTTQLRLANRSYGEAQFTFDNPRSTAWQKRGEVTEPLPKQNHKYIYLRDEGYFESPENVNTVRATVSYPFSLNESHYKSDHEIFINEEGRVDVRVTPIFEEEQETRRSLLSFDNRFARKIHVDISTGDFFSVAFDVDPKKTHSVALPQVEGEKAQVESVLVMSYETNSVQLALGCKVAKYGCVIEKDGRLSLQMAAMKKREHERPVVKIKPDHITTITFGKEGVKVQGPQPKKHHESAHGNLKIFNETPNEFWTRLKIALPNGQEGATPPFRISGDSLSRSHLWAKTVDQLVRMDENMDQDRLQAFTAASEITCSVTLAEELIPAF